MCYPCLLHDCFLNIAIVLLKFWILFPHEYNFLTKLVFAFCAFRTLNTLAHISFEQQQLSSEAHFWGMEKFSLVQEGLIQTTKQKPSWASSEKVRDLHTKNVTVKRLSFGMLLSRVFLQFIMNTWNQFGNHCFFIAPRVLHVRGPQFSGPRGWGGSVSKAMERAQHRILKSLQKDPPHSNFPSDHCNSLKRMGRWERSLFFFALRLMMKIIL